MIPFHPTCVRCGRVISLFEHQAFQGTCDNWSCRSVVLNRMREQRHAAEQRYEEVHERRRRIAASARDAAGVNCPAFSVPAMLRPLTALSPKRKQEFQQHWERLIAAAFEAEVDASHDVETSASPESAVEPSPVLAAACGTCQGVCCQTGGTRAYTTEALVNRYRQAHPTATPEEILEDYVSRIPEFTFQDSCVFHEQAGCALPRELRSDTCNQFSCEELSRIQEGQRALVVAIDFGEVVRTRLVDR